MEISQRAKVCLDLLHVAIADDDQDAADFLCDAIQRDQLYRYYTNDDGTSVGSFHEFVVELNAECGNAEPIGTSPVASAVGDNRPLCEMTAQERRARRLAIAAQLNN